MRRAALLGAALPLVAVGALAGLRTLARSRTVQLFGTIVSRNEVAWLEAIREASGHSDPSLTSKARVAIRGIFNK